MFAVCLIASERGRPAAQTEVQFMINPVPPLTAPEFAEAMRALGCSASTGELAVAVSGGPDSLALCFLAAEWCRDNGVRLTGLTVDHGLRPESPDEAARVGDWLGSIGIAHHVLSWLGIKPQTGIQEAARDARYRLLLDWAHAHGITNILFAHHLEDQAETFLLRACHGSGIGGLAGMQPAIEREGVRILRPLLGFPRARLAAILTAASHPSIDDPSNRDRRFARVQVRSLLPELAARDVPPERISALSKRFASLRIALDGVTAVALSSCCRVYPAGYAEIDIKGFSRLPRFLAQRALAALIADIGSSRYPARRRRLARLAAALADSPTFRGATLGDCRFQVQGERILVCRELRKPMRQSDVPHGVELLWWRGFQWTLPRETARLSGLTIGPLGTDGWREVRNSALVGAESSHPVAVRPTLPTLFLDGKVYAVPHLGYTSHRDNSGETIQCVWRPSSASVRITSDCLASSVKDTICNA